MRYLYFIGLLALSGCASSPSSNGVHWWSPATWGSTSEAKKADRLDAKATEARESLIKEAQKTAHETSIALVEIPASKAKETAQESNGQTVLLLDQAVGPLTAKEAAAIRQQVTLLLSSNAALQKKGEELRQESRQTIERLSQQLASLQAKLDAANQALPDALRREAATANKYRNLVFYFWSLVGVSVVIAGVTLYLKIVYGGVYSAIGKGLSSIYTAHPEQAQNIELLLSKHLSPSALKKILGNSA